MSLYGESDGREPYRRVDEALRTIAKTLHPRTPLFYTVGESVVNFRGTTCIEGFDAKLSCAFFGQYRSLRTASDPS